MVLVRMVFQVRQGHIRDLVEAMKQLTQAEPNRPRILTDLSGPFNTWAVAAVQSAHSPVRVERADAGGLGDRVGRRLCAHASGVAARGVLRVDRRKAAWRSFVRSGPAWLQLSQQGLLFTEA